MKTNLSIALAVSLALAVVPLMAASAGGWAVVILDELPTGLRAEEPLHIGFTVLQHGRTPLPGLAPLIVARLSGTSRSMHWEAVEDGPTGHYAVEVVFPEEGQWEWYVDAFSAAHPMPALTVAAPAAASAASESISQAPAALTYGAVLGTAALAAGLLLLRRRRMPRLAWLLPVTAGVLVLVGFALVALQRGVARPAGDSTSLTGEADLGRQLFVAKGCVTCHVNETVGADSMSFAVGPNLSFYKNDPAFLEKWLRAPGSVRPAAQMPDLDLDDEEIAALIAFLNAD